MYKGCQKHDYQSNYCNASQKKETEQWEKTFGTIERNEDWKSHGVEHHKLICIYASLFDVVAMVLFTKYIVLLLFLITLSILGSSVWVSTFRAKLIE